MELQDLLTKLTAYALMEKDVVSVGPKDPLAVAATRLLLNQISGLPVVDPENERCVGVLSASDIVHAEGHVASETKRLAESSFFNSSPPSSYIQKTTRTSAFFSKAAVRKRSTWLCADVRFRPIAAVILSPENITL